MPELPEVETVVRALRPRLEGRQILRAQAFAARLRQPLCPEDFAAMSGRTVLAVRRRAKYIVCELSGAQLLLLHLGMTGACRIVPAELPRAQHEHVLWWLDNGQTWRFCDPRRFGLVELHPWPRPEALPACLAELGPEPLGPDFDGAALHALCRERGRPIKVLLMDHTVLAGVGNIYASEALHRAGIAPGRAAGGLTRSRCERLAQSVREVLLEAIAAGGTTISDYRDPDGQEGHFARELRVYDRAGTLCPRCRRGRIRRSVLAGRSTYHCPVCQR